MKLVYEWIQGGDGGSDTTIGLLELKPDEKETDFMNALFEGVRANEEMLKDEIAKYLSSGWTLERLAKVDLSILLVAMYEMRCTELPASIAINEAVELANAYSTEKAGSFINGLLGSAARSEADA